MVLNPSPHLRLAMAAERHSRNEFEGRRGESNHGL
jgi:hypothetical protein